MVGQIAGCGTCGLCNNEICVEHAALWWTDANMNCLVDICHNCLDPMKLVDKWGFYSEATFGLTFMEWLRRTGYAK